VQRSRNLLVAALAASLSVAACRSRSDDEKAAPTLQVTTVRDEAVTAPPADASSVASWPELEELPRAEPVRVILVPARPDVPRFEVGGPMIDGDIAVVSSSQLGFAAVSWRRGTLLWTKPAGTRVAPPLVHDGRFVLIGACLSPPEVPDDHLLLGCLRVVTPDGADQAYLAVHGKAKRVAAFAGAVGEQEVTATGEHTVRWRRGDAAVTVDLVRGIATPTPATPTPVVVEHGGRRWEIVHDETLVARSKGKIAWATEHEVTALLGAVWLPEQSPMIRYANLSAHGDRPVIRLLDIDATGSMHGQAALTATPGIGLLGHAISPVGDVALAIRLDRSIQRDYIAAYAANALLMWVYPLPQIPRADPVGVAIALDEDSAPEAVVVFHDGDTVTVLPSLSAPPTAPGAARAPLEKPTP